MASAFSWPIRQVTYADAKTAFWNIVDQLVNGLGWTIAESTPNPWRANASLVVNNDEVVLSNPASGSPRFQVKFVYKTDVDGAGNPGFTTDISPMVTHGVPWGTNPTGGSGGLVVLGTGSSVRITLMGSADVFIVWCEFAGMPGLGVLYMGRYEPFETAEIDPFNCMVSLNGKNGGGVFTMTKDNLKVYDPTGTPQALPGFWWIPSPAGRASTDPYFPFKSTNGRCTKSGNYKQAAIVVEFQKSDHSIIDCAGRMCGIYLMPFNDATIEGRVFGTPGSYVTYFGGADAIAWPWPDTNPPLTMLV